MAVLGLGHVGLPTALGLAELGWDVIGADNNLATIESLQAGVCPFYEPAMHELLTKHLGNPRFSVTHDVEEAIRSATVLFVCVGTPQAANGQADMSCVEELARLIARNLTGYKLIVEKSTVPAITGNWIRRTVLRHAAAFHGRRNGNGNGNGHHAGALCEMPVFEVASNPEFLQEGKAIQDFFTPDRIVCGVTSHRARAILAELYQDVKAPILFTDLTTAELIKYAANAFLATKISFINMVADVCEAVGADVTQVAAGIGMDSRIGSRFLNAGLGFGGYCLPKDLRAFIHLGEENNVDCSLLREADNINQARVDRLVRKLREALWVVRGKTIAVLGLAFKAGTDDVRDAPSFRVIEKLLCEGANLRLYDPKAMEAAQRILPAETERITYCQNAYEAAADAEAALILTEWDEFRRLDLHMLRQVMHIPIVLDARNLLDPQAAREVGFEYICMGRSGPAGSPAPAPVEGRVQAQAAEVDSDRPPLLQLQRRSA